MKGRGQYRRNTTLSRATHGKTHAHVLLIMDDSGAGGDAAVAQSSRGSADADYPSSKYSPTKTANVRQQIKAQPRLRQAS